MTRQAWKVAAVSALSALAAAARAHDFECEKGAGVVQVDAEGRPVIGDGGLPRFSIAPAPVLEVNRYPAVLGLRTIVRNVATEPSVVTGAVDPLLESLQGVTRFGATFSPGFSLGVGASAFEVATVPVASQEECVKLFGSSARDELVCRAVGEDRLVVEHEAGSAECRARVICGAPAAPPACGDDTWHGIKQFESGAGTGISVHDSCRVDLAGTLSTSGFLARLDASGSRTELTTFGATNRPVFVAGLAVDPAGNRWVAWNRGTFSFFSEANASRFAEDGREMLRHVLPGQPTANPPRPVIAESIAVDAAGDAYLAGETDGALPGFTNAGGSDAVAVKIDGATGDELWSLQFGNAGRDFATATALEPGGSLLVVGSTTGAMAGNVSAGGSDAFVARIGRDGELLDIIQLGTAADDIALGVTVDPSGNVYVTGSTFGDLAGSSSAGDSDAFLMKLDPLLSPVWFRQLGSDLADEARRVAVNAAGDAWIAGSTRGALPGQPAAVLRDAFVARYDASGNLLWVRQFGSPEQYDANDIAIDAVGAAYVTGLFGVGAGQIFVAKIGPDGALK